MVSMSIMWKFIFPPPPSVFIKAMSVISLTSLAFYGFSEIRGKYLNYSKFWNVSANDSDGKRSLTNKPRKQQQARLSGRTGMLLLYTPAFLVALASLVFFNHGDDARNLLLTSALALHFLKRIFEVYIPQFFNFQTLSLTLSVTLIIIYDVCNNI